MNERQLRYQQKINFICEKMENLPVNPTGLLIDAVLYRVQVSIDALTDIVAMLVKDIGAEVSDDYNNIDLLSAKKVVTAKEAEMLKKCNGLRNAIVHKYNHFEEQEVIRNITRIRRDFYELINTFEQNIKKIFAQ